MSQAVMNLDPVQRGAVSRLSSVAMLFFTLFVSAVLSACSGSSKSSSAPPANVGGGYTLMASGGTLNDGSGTKGLVVLATLRDSQGWGPSFPWTIKITGPGISSSSPLTLLYQDSRIGSYMSWEWAGFAPLSGTYRATATNPDGTISIYYDFQVSTTSALARPAPSVSPSGGYTLSWQAIAGATSYSYEVFPPGGGVSLYGTTSTTSVTLGPLTTNGDYLARVRAYSTDRSALSVSSAPSPVLAPQENASEYTFTFPVGGDQTSGNYSFTVAGGVMDYGLRGPGASPINGLAIWTSILNTTTPNPTAPAGNWNIRITDPNGTVLNYIYPAGKQHYAYWYYSIVPVAGTYTVTATYGAASRTAMFTLSDISSRLAPLTYTEISASMNATTKDITITWPAVTNARSYYVNLWADVWNNTTRQFEYKEVWRSWVSSTSVTIVKSTSAIPAGLSCDVFVTAHEINMTTSAPPSPLPARADMSENYYSYVLPFLTP